MTELGQGILYLVATPIGNLQDLTDRARATLAEADLIAAEDTRRTRQLLSHLGLRKPLESYHEHAEREKAEVLIGRLRQGARVALVSDAGVPGISDPGAHLVARAWDEGIRIIPIPGPSALVCALSVAGLEAPQFMFAGYPPRAGSERRAFYRRLAGLTVPMVIYETPHRLRASLQDAAAELGQGRVALVAREMTKQFEQYQRGPLGELLHYWEQAEPVGEFTLVFAPADKAETPRSLGQPDPMRAASLLVQAGIGARQASDILSAASGLSHREAYALILAARKR